MILYIHRRTGDRNIGASRKRLGGLAPSFFLRYVFCFDSNEAISRCWPTNRRITPFNCFTSLPWSSAIAVIAVRKALSRRPASSTLLSS